MAHYDAGRRGGVHLTTTRFLRTVKEEFYEITFRKKVYAELDDLQADLDAWVDHYNHVSYYTPRYVFEKSRLA